MAAPAQTKAPAPDFVAESLAQEVLAETAVRACDGRYEIDHQGMDRHKLALFAKFSDRGVHMRQVQELYNMPSREDVYRHRDAFMAKYDLGPQTSVQAFCDAIQAEIDWRTPVGQLVKATAP
ncbi:MAG: hypothetical protein AAFO93_13370 [Pseudomonadota bacterium]